MTTHDTPKAALAAALKRHHDNEGFCVYCSSERVFEPWPCDAARAREEIARLREALALANSMIRSGERHSGLSEAVISAALAPSEPS